MLPQDLLHVLIGLVFNGVLLLVVFVGLGFLMRLSRGRKADRSEYRAAPLLSPAEANFYRCLVELYGVSATVCPKVRLLDLVCPRQGLDRRKHQIALNRVYAKHVDFVILQNQSLNVIGVVELDDRSHELQPRVARDRFADDALRQAGIRVCRVKVRRQYDLQVLSDQLNSVFVAAVSEPVAASEALL